MGRTLNGEFLDLMDRAAADCGVTGHDRAVEWMRQHGVSGDVATLSWGDVTRLTVLATGIIRRKHAHDGQVVPPVVPPEPSESARRAGES